MEPAPTWTVPAEMVNAPEKALSPSMIRVLSPEPAVFAKPVPLLIWPTLRKVPERRLSEPVPLPTETVSLPMSNPPRSSVPPLRSSVVFSVPGPFV